MTMKQEWHDSATSTDLLNYFLWGLSRTAVPGFFGVNGLKIGAIFGYDVPLILTTASLCAAGFLANSWQRATMKKSFIEQNYADNNQLALDSEASNAVKILRMEGNNIARFRELSTIRMIESPYFSYEWKIFKHKCKQEQDKPPSLPKNEPTPLPM